MAFESFMIVVDKLCYSVGEGEQRLSIIEQLSFSVAEGESVAITGSSGSGKSSLLALLAGLDVATSGDIIIDGANLSTQNEDQRALFRAQNLGFVFQSFHLLPSLSAFDNVLLALNLAAAPNAKERALAALDAVGLSARVTHKPQQLSGGEQQRVAIARAFACSPKYLFADEPTGNLDSKTGASIIDLLFSLNAQYQTTLVLVTHEQRLADRCGRRLLLESGKLVEV
jgi:putative ABC transport system ATP-binding protein